MRKAGVATISYGNSKKELDQGLDAVLGLWGLLIERAMHDQPDIILLPEHFAFTGMNYKLNEICEDIYGNPGPVTKFVAEQARRHSAYVFASYPRQAENGAGFYNSAVLFDRQGKIACVYDKVFPTVGELERGILPGKAAVPFDADFGRIGAGICFDFNFRELFADYRRQKTELFCFLSAFPAGFQIPIMAYENQMFIASAICLPKGRIVNPLGRILIDGGSHAAVIFAEINLDCRVIHIDYNNKQIPALKEKYKQQVRIDVAGDEAVYLVSSFHPELTVNDMIKEFELETLDDYLNRARVLRKTKLGNKASR